MPSQQERVLLLACLFYLKAPRLAGVWFRKLGNKKRESEGPPLLGVSDLLKL